MDDSPVSSGVPDHSIAPVALMTGQDDSVSHSLAVLAKVYHYNHWVFDSLRDHIGPTVLEVGAGVGNITQFLLNQAEVVCLEPFGPFREQLAKRFSRHLNVTVLDRRIEDCPNEDLPEGRFDSVICINVLEHIEDDVGALVRMRRLVRQGGRVIVFVPALPVLYGALDKAMGHLRRYTLGSLRRTFRQAGLRPCYGRYVNAIGAIAWWWCGRVLRKTRISESATMSFDRLVPILSAVERLLPPFFGQSTFLIGEAI